jgi:hypothetical protein
MTSLSQGGLASVQIIALAEPIVDRVSLTAEAGFISSGLNSYPWRRSSNVVDAKDFGPSGGSGDDVQVSAEQALRVQIAKQLAKRAPDIADESDRNITGRNHILGWLREISMEFSAAVKALSAANVPVSNQFVKEMHERLWQLHNSAHAILDQGTEANLPLRIDVDDDDSVDLKVGAFADSVTVHSDGFISKVQYEGRFSDVASLADRVANEIQAGGPSGLPQTSLKPR